MNRRIIVERGEVRKIARMMGCSPDWVGHSLAYRRDSELSRRIRKLALERGGVEIGGRQEGGAS